MTHAFMDPENPPATAPEQATTDHACPAGECYCPDGSEPRWCGHGPGGTCSEGHCYACGACYCGED